MEAEIASADIALHPKSAPLILVLGILLRSVDSKTEPAAHLPLPIPQPSVRARAAG